MVEQTIETTCDLGRHRAHYDATVMNDIIRNIYRNTNHQMIKVFERGREPDGFFVGGGLV